MIDTVDPDGDHSELRSLLVEFHEWMVDHESTYDPEAELTEDLESVATDPESWAWVAHEDGDPAGCVLLHGESETLTEFRRLWVRPSHRGTGLGRSLTQRVLEKAQSEGYETLALTTPPWAEASHALYESMGFERTPPYPETRLPEKHHDEAIFMRRSLGDS